jgi:O-antigen/teichoic acid export membrane protein
LQEQIFDNQLGHAIRIVSPLLLIYPLELCLQNVFTGDNKIGKLGIMRVLPRATYLAVIGFLALSKDVSLQDVLFAHMLTIAGILIILLTSTRPLFSEVRSNFKILIQENRSFGLPVYVGILANVATSQISGVSIGYFIDNTSVGFFAIAQSISQPLQMLPAAIGTVYFKYFANATSIPRKVVILAFSVSAVGLLIAFSAVDFVVLTLYTEEYRAAVGLAYWTIAGAILHGLGGLYNRFLGAQGQGIMLRNSAFAQGIVNVCGYIGLVYFIGVYGAAYTRFAAGLVYFMALLFFYRTYVKNRGGSG